MNHDFRLDQLVSYSAVDEAGARSLAMWQRADLLKVWFGEWVQKPGDSIPAKIEDGLEHSRVLVLCMSAQAFGANWAHFEADKFRFRDPLSENRRFIPLRLDDARMQRFPAQFKCVVGDSQIFN